MAEDFQSPVPLKEILRLVIQIEGLLDEGALRMEHVLPLRQRIYDIMKHLENMPIQVGGENLYQVTARAFALLQARLRLPAVD